MTTARIQKELNSLGQEIEEQAQIQENLNLSTTTLISTTENVTPGTHIIETAAIQVNPEENLEKNSVSESNSINENERTSTSTDEAKSTNESNSVTEDSNQSLSEENHTHSTSTEEASFENADSPYLSYSSSEDDGYSDSDDYDIDDVVLTNLITHSFLSRRLPRSAHSERFEEQYADQNKNSRCPDGCTIL